MFEQGETVEFGGKIITNMALNPDIMKYSCKIVTGADYAHKYGIFDIDNRRIASHRELANLGQLALPKPMRFLAKYFPTAKVPQFVFDIGNSKMAR